MKKILASFALALCAMSTYAQDTLWAHAADRFGTHMAIDMREVDSIVFNRQYMRFYNKEGYGARRTYASKYDYYTFQNPGLSLYRPNDLRNNDFDNTGSQWCFARSRESEHFILFWDAGFGMDPKVGRGAARFDPDELLANAEYFFEMYTDSLGFAPKDIATTINTYKLEIFVNSKSEWLATGSGYDDKIGALWCNYSAVNSHSTLAHEIGHSFQYLVSCDLGTDHGWRWGFGANASGGCAWWESCAQWQAFRCYPQEKFGSWFSPSYFHLNLLHEEWRYYNFFIQDYWCQLHGDDFIGRLWRESKKPEDPVETYKRMTGTDQATFNAQIYDYAARSATWDFDAIRQQGKGRMIQTTTLKQLDADQRLWQATPEQCPQNYGYNLVQLTARPEGTVVRAHFKGIAGADGFRRVQTDKAGWRYGFVAIDGNGQRTYGPMYASAEGTAEMTMPAGVQKLWFVVAGAPTEHWRHAWDDDVSNDEQWPYEVRFEQTDLAGYYLPEGGVPTDSTFYATVEIPYDAAGNMVAIADVSKEALGQTFMLTPDRISAVGNSEADALCTFVRLPNGTPVVGTDNNLYCFKANGNITPYNAESTEIAVYGSYLSYYGGFYIIANGRCPDVKAGATFTMPMGIRYKPEGDERSYYATYVITVKIV